MTLISQDDHRIVGAWAACEEHNHHQTTKRNSAKDDISHTDLQLKFFFHHEISMPIYDIIGKFFFIESFSVV